MITYDCCLYCTKKLRTKVQKRFGYCSNAENIAHLHLKLDLLLAKLENEEKLFDNVSFIVDPSA